MSAAEQRVALESLIVALGSGPRPVVLRRRKLPEWTREREIATCVGVLVDAIVSDAVAEVVAKLGGHAGAVAAGAIDAGMKSHLEIWHGAGKPITDGPAL